MGKIVKEVQHFVRIVFFTILKFYDLQINPRDLKKDLLINMVTTFIMKKNLYSVIMKSITYGN